MQRSTVLACWTLFRLEKVVVDLMKISTSELRIAYNPTWFEYERVSVEVTLFVVAFLLSPAVSYTFLICRRLYSAMGNLGYLLIMSGRSGAPRKDDIS